MGALGKEFWEVINPSFDLKVVTLSLVLLSALTVMTEKSLNSRSFSLDNTLTRDFLGRCPQSPKTPKLVKANKTKWCTFHLGVTTLFSFGHVTSPFYLYLEVLIEPQLYFLCFIRSSFTPL